MRTNAYKSMTVLLDFAPHPSRAFKNALTARPGPALGNRQRR